MLFIQFWATYSLTYIKFEYEPRHMYYKYSHVVIVSLFGLRKSSSYFAYHLKIQRWNFYWPLSHFHFSTILGNIHYWRKGTLQLNAINHSLLTLFGGFVDVGGCKMASLGTVVVPDGITDVTKVFLFFDRCGLCPWSTLQYLWLLTVRRLQYFNNKLI